ncbi:MAG: hypothetical protein F6J95_024290 [Leptolyngbya sp. SIO1E4]|nr:hypothetical protein [Leptolyngbya sp. SIO1E4]
MSFVGTQIVETPEALKVLLNQVQGEKRCFFLRWPHKVSGLCRNLPGDFPSPEGQVFTSDREIRWKKHRHGYSVLVLSQTDAVEGFDPIKPNTEWETCDREAHVYPPTETRFPKGIASDGINIGQRYFRDKKTAMVHFIASVAK